MYAFFYRPHLPGLAGKEETMTQVRKRAVLSLVIWCLVATGFVISFLTQGGPATYADQPTRILIGAVFLAFGFAAYPIMLWATRSRSGSVPVISDERDEWIALRASRGALVSVLVLMFLACIWLWIIYRDEKAVPVGWMWFLGYGAAILGYLAQSIATLIIDRGVNDRA
jgi:hypothetical protein